MPDKLNGLPVVITRQADQAAELAELVEQNGGKPLLIPLIRTDFFTTKEINFIAEQIEQADWVIFSSANGVRGFNRLNIKLGADTKIAAVGSKTADALKSAGYRVDLVPQTQNARGILAALACTDLRGKQILLPGAQKPRPELAAGLAEMGADVMPLPLYRTVPEPEADQAKLLEIWNGTAAACITFFSPSAVNALRMIIGDSRPANNRLIFAPVGDTTAAALTQAKLPLHFTPSAPSARGVVDGLISFLKQS